MLQNSLKNCVTKRRQKSSQEALKQQTKKKRWNGVALMFMLIKKKAPKLEFYIDRSPVSSEMNGI